MIGFNIINYYHHESEVNNHLDLSIPSISSALFKSTQLKWQWFWRRKLQCEVSEQKVDQTNLQTL